jgi:DNA-binding transcriptional MerR regulator
MNVQTKIESPASAKPELPLAALQQLLDEANARLVQAKKMSADIEAEIAKRVASVVQQARELAGKTEGSIRVVVDGCEVKSTIPKKIKWSNEGLNDVAREIAAGGADPYEWIKFEASISEKVFEVMPDALKKLCAPHRTLSHGKETIEVTVV